MTQSRLTITDKRQAFRKLHEAHDIGWSFWTYKNMDSTSTVVSIQRPEGWDEIVAYADGRTPTRPADALIDKAMRQYLDGILFRNATVRWSYLASLGLKAGL